MRKNSLIINFLGILLIAVSFNQLANILFYRAYRWYFLPLPEWLILMRYFFSVFLRMTLIICGVGLIYRKEFFRKALVYINIFTLLTIYWKHPFSVVDKSAQVSLHILKSLESFLVLPSFIISHLTLIMFFMAYAWDITFSSLLIWYFTRRSVKREFV